MHITNLGQDPAAIQQAVVAAKKGRCCSWRRDYVVTAIIKAKDGTTTETTHRVSMNWFERVVAVICKMFCIDLVKRKLHAYSIKSLNETASVGGKNVGRRKKLIDDEVRLSKILSVGFDGLSTPDVSVAKNLASVMLEFLKAEECQKTYFTDGEIPEDYRGIGCNEFRNFVAEDLKEKVSMSSIRDAFRILLLDEKIQWVQRSDQGYFLGFKEERPANDQPVETKNLLMNLEQKRVDVGELGADPEQINIALLEQFVNVVNSDVYYYSIGERNARIVTKNFLRPGERFSEQEKKQYAAVLNFLVDKGVIYAWNYGIPFGRSFENTYVFQLTQLSHIPEDSYAFFDPWKKNTALLG